MLLKKNRSKIYHVIGVVVLFMLMTSCKKETLEQEPTCQDINHLGSWYTGKWIWERTEIITPDSSYQLNPSNSYEYYFTISEDKIYRGYKNGVLVDNFLISENSHMNYSSTFQSLKIFENCTNENFSLIPGISQGGALANIGSNTKYPIYIYHNDSSGTTMSYYNIFIKVE